MTATRVTWRGEVEPGVLTVECETGALRDSMRVVDQYGDAWTIVQVVDQHEPDEELWCATVRVAVEAEE